MPLPQRFGARLRMLRDARGLTQEELATRMGVNVHTVSRWETGERHPSLQDATDLAKVLEYSISVVAGEREPSSDAPVVRSEPLYFVNAQRLEAAKNAKTLEELNSLILLGIATRVDPEDMRVVEEQFWAAHRAVEDAKKRLR